MRISIIIACLLALLLLSGTAVRAQYEQSWLGTRSGYWGVAVDMDSQGNVYTTGRGLDFAANNWHRDIHTIKYAPDGTQLWVREYDNDDDLTVQDDDPNWIRVDSQDNVLVLGSTHTNAAGREAVLLKYDPTGVLLWERLHGGPGITADYGRYMEFDGLDNIYITGRTFGFDKWDFFTAKYDPDGNLLWSRTRSFGGPDEPVSIAVDGAGNVAVVGANWSQQIATVVYDTDGEELWSDLLDDPNPAQSYNPSHAVFDAEGNLLLTGHRGQVGLVNMLLVKYAPGGTMLFERLYAEGTSVRLRVDAAGNAIMTGQSWSTYDMLTTKVDAQGNELWTAVHEWIGQSYGRDLRVLSDDGIVVAGTDRNEDWVLVKYDADGIEEWNLSVDVPGVTSTNYPRMMAVDASENIAVTGGAAITTALFNPSGTPTAIGDPVLAPTAAFLRAAYPNPFNPSTALSFRLERPMAVTLAIYDPAGRHVKTILREHMIEGEHVVSWDGADENGRTMSSGVYFARLDAGGKSMSRKLIMLK